MMYLVSPPPLTGSFRLGYALMLLTRKLNCRHYPQLFMRLSSLIVILLLVGVLSSETIVTIGTGMNYSGLQEAINAVINPQDIIDSEIVFRLFPSDNPYSAPLTGYSLNLEYPSLDRVTIEGYSPTETIQIQHNGGFSSGVFTVTGSDLHSVEFELKNLEIASLYGNAVECASRFAYLEISNCKFFTRSGVHLGNSMYQPKVVIRDNDFDLSGSYGIMQPGWIDSLFIQNNRFIGEYGNLYANLTGSGFTLISDNVFNGLSNIPNTLAKLHVINQTPAILQYPHCHIHNNRFVNSAITTSQVVCRIESNSFRYGDNCSPASKRFFLELADSGVDFSHDPIIIKSNLFIGTSTLGAVVFSENGSNSYVAMASISNNSFIEAGNAIHVTLTNQAYLDGSFIIDFTNNLFNNCSASLVQVINGVGANIQLQHPILVDYSVVYPTFQSGNAVLDPSTCSIADPEIEIDLSTPSYQLLWTESVKSPCINTGYPGENFELTDPDGTPPDIGCVYYPHHNAVYFSDRVSLIEWLSFPVIDDRTSVNGQHWDELGYMFQTHMEGPPTSSSQLNQIQWSYRRERSTMLYDNSLQEWANITEKCIQSKGYKVQFNQGTINTVVVDGFKADPDTTPSAWTVDVEENGQIRSFENWIGYFVPYTQNAEIALSRLIPGTLSKYLDYVHTIKTRTWGTCRYAPELGSPWIAEPEKYTFSEGDMVILLLIPHAPDEMYWSNDGVDTKPVIRPQATAFTYEEKLDYTSVFIEFNPEDMPDEVGLYVNGVCMGAAVVDSSLIDVCFYNETAKDGGELEIVFYYEGKGKQAAKGWTSYNPDSMVFENSGIDVNNIGDYAYISFKSGAGDSPVPLFTSLQPNYPNPFNPSTNISFILSKDMNARLDIYNVRGQRVKTMLNAAIGKGKHTLEWSGRDEHGRPVSSGIYFSRLTTPEGVFSHKMMLMK